ncbi:hypothetical protein MKX08_009962 [Trichoderma sp. CBMAI-0020]|nr:hypothetical protein MKX08_009962 [Trichoderma sp. CBMAI-0020]
MPDHDCSQFSPTLSIAARPCWNVGYSVVTEHKFETMSAKERRGRSETISPEASFSNKEASRVHGAFGGLRVEPDGKLRCPVPKNLENIRRVVVESELLGSRLMLQPNHSEDEVQEWNQLLDKLAETELKATDLNKGASRIFSGMLITVGKNKETIDPWVNLIPNDYGLCIGKSGLLVLLAQRHADKKQKIIDEFSEIHQIICNATLKRRSFQTDAQICESAGNLYVNIADAIEELLDIVLAPSTFSRLRSKLLREGKKRLIAKEEPQFHENSEQAAPVNFQQQKEQEPQVYKESEQVSLFNSQQQKAVIAFKRLLQILSAPAPDQIPVGNNGIELQHILAQRGEDLETVVNWSSMVDPSAQAQAHSILVQDRFLQWMRSEHPDMLLIDGNLSPAALLPSKRTLPYSWYGPIGLARSVIMQVLLVLYERSLLDLNILDRRSFVQLLENHSLDDLCIFLHQLNGQFPPDTTVFLVIDGISHFDLDLNRLFKKLVIVLECLQRIVEDDNLRPKFKVLMTTPTNSSWRIGRVVDKKYRLGLPSTRLASLQLSPARMNMALGGDRRA